MSLSELIELFPNPLFYGQAQKTSKEFLLQCSSLVQAVNPKNGEIKFYLKSKTIGTNSDAINSAQNFFDLLAQSKFYDNATSKKPGIVSVNQKIQEVKKSVDEEQVENIKGVTCEKNAVTNWISCAFCDTNVFSLLNGIMHENTQDHQKAQKNIEYYAINGFAFRLPPTGFFFLRVNPIVVHANI